MAIVHMGYIGGCSITSATAATNGSGGQFFITASSINPVQDLNVPEMLEGRYTPYLYNWGKIEVNGNVSGYAFDSTGGSGGDAKVFWEWAKTRGSGGGTAADKDRMTYNDLTIDIYYFNAAGRSFSTCSINTFECTVTAGDVANFTLDFMGKNAGLGSAGQLTGSAPQAAGLMRLITWDACVFTGAPFGSQGLQGFSVNLANNLQRQYSINQADFNAFDITAGMQKLTGTVTTYAQGAPGMNSARDSFATSQTGSAGQPVTIQVGTAGSFVNIVGAQVLFKRDQASAKTDAVTYTVDYQALAFDDAL